MRHSLEAAPAFPPDLMRGIHGKENLVDDR